MKIIDIYLIHSYTLYSFSLSFPFLHFGRFKIKILKFRLFIFFSETLFFNSFFQKLPINCNMIPLDDIKNNKPPCTLWILSVKVIRKWRQLTNIGEIIGIIFSDDPVTRISCIDIFTII